MAKRRIILNEDQLPDFGGGSLGETLTLSTIGLNSNVDMTGYDYLKVDCTDGDITIDGIVAKPENSIIHIYRAITANKLTIMHESGSASASLNKFWLSPKYTKDIYLYNCESFIYQTGIWIPLGHSGFLEGNDAPEDQGTEFYGYNLILDSGTLGNKIIFSPPNILKQGLSVSGTSTTFNSMSVPLAGDFIKVAYSGAVTINGLTDLTSVLNTGSWIKRVTIVNRGTDIITINHENTNALEFARFNLNGGSSIKIYPNKTKEFLYYNGKYREHEESYDIDLNTSVVLKPQIGAFSSYAGMYTSIYKRRGNIGSLYLSFKTSTIQQNTASGRVYFEITNTEFYNEIQSTIGAYPSNSEVSFNFTSAIPWTNYPYVSSLAILSGKIVIYLSKKISSAISEKDFNNLDYTQATDLQYSTVLQKNLVNLTYHFIF